MPNFFCPNKNEFLLKVCFFLTASCPTLAELVAFPMPGEKINLTEEIGTHYMEFGTSLLKDSTGELLRSFEKELRGNAGDINARVLSWWLSGKGKQPVSWDTLIAVLHDIKLNRLARDIKKALNS